MVNIYNSTGNNFLHCAVLY